jgi:hypothetical protein
MSRYAKREKLCNKCYACQFDCVQVEPIEYCENFVKGYTRQEYMDMLRSENVNLKALCTKHRISYNYLLKMLEGRINFSYKYRMILNSRLGELEEYLPYVNKFENEEVGVISE